MPIQLKLRKIGNSVGVVLPKEALVRLQAAEGDTLYLTDAPDQSMRLSAGDPDFAKTMATFESLNRRYRNALRKLAE